MSTPLLDIGVLGTTRVIQLGTGTAIRGGAARNLVAVLAAVDGHRMSADRLSEALWPTEPPDNPVAALRNVAWRARRAFAGDLITTLPDGSYELDADRCLIDAVRFRDLLARARGLQGIGSPVESSAVLDEAISLWRGTALENFPDADWAAPLRAQWTELLLGAREERAELGPEVGAGERAEAELMDICSRHPDREHAWSLLIGQLGRLGRHIDARRTYDRARRHLAEHGLEPGAELRMALEGLARSSITNVQQIDLGSASITGREHEIEAVLTAIRDSRTSRRSKLVIIEGEAGVGKSLLARAVVAGAQTEGRILAWFAGCDPRSVLPYAPLIDLVGALQPTGGRQALVPSAGADWLESGSGVPEPLSHWRIRDQFAVLLGQAVARVGAELLVLVVDDVQWATAPTLDVLTHLLGLSTDVPTVVIATRRTHGDEPARVDALEQMQRRCWSERIEIAGLPETASAALFTSSGGDASRAREVWRLTGGNPFFLVELGRSDPALSAAMSRVAPSRALDRAMAARLGELPDPARRVLELAAAIGTEFDEVLLSTAAQMAAQAGVLVDPSAAVDAVITALHAGLVIQVDRAPRHWMFRHDLLRRSLYFGLEGRDRAAVHLAVARALQRLATHRPVSASRLALHLADAWPLCSAEEAAEQLLTAAQMPSALLDPRTSLELGTRGLDLLASDPGQPADLTCRLLICRGTALTELGDRPAARDSLRAAVDLAAAQPVAVAHRVAAAVSLARTWVGETLPADVVELLGSAARDHTAGAVFDRCEAIGLLQAVAPQDAGPLALAVSEEAIELGDVFGARTALVSSWRWQRAGVRPATTAKLVDLASRTGVPTIAADAAVRRAIDLAQLGEALSIPAVPLSRWAGDRPPGSAAEAVGTIWSITANIACGHFADARRLIAQAALWLTDVATVGRVRPVSVAEMLAAQVAMLATFTDLDSDRVLISPGVGDAARAADAESPLAQALSARDAGDVVRARSWCTTLLDQAEPVLTSDPVADLAQVAEVCLDVGHQSGIERCLTLLAAFEELHVVRGAHEYRGPISLVMGRLHAAAGDLPSAVRQLGHAVDRAELVGARPWQVVAGRLLAPLARITGDCGDAARVTAEADRLAATLGMTSSTATPDGDASQEAADPDRISGQDRGSESRQG